MEESEPYDMDGEVNSEINKGVDAIEKITPGVDEDVDLDVIDCYTDDFDSDMEGDFCRKETQRLAGNMKRTAEGGSDGTKEMLSNRKSDDSDETSKVVTPSSHLNKNKPKINVDDDENASKPDERLSYDNKNPTSVVPGEVFDDEDMIQIDHNDILPRDGANNCGIDQPEISPNAEDELKQKRILSGPLIKQMVIPEIETPDCNDEKTDVESQESMSLLIDNVGKSSDPSNDVSELKSSESDVENITNDGCQQEDPEVLQLKLDLYQNIGAMDYEAHHEARSDTSKEQKTDEEDKARDSQDTIFIKQEKITPVKDRLGGNDIDEKHIPTIDLTLSDEEDASSAEELPENVGNKEIECRTEQKNLKMKKTAYNDTDSKKQSVAPSPGGVTCVESTVSRKRKDSDACSSASMDDLLYDTFYGDRVLSLRKRNVTILPEAVLSIATRKMKPRRCSIDDQIWFKRSAKKKKEDPLMKGYKRRRSTSKSISKCSGLIPALSAEPSIPSPKTSHMNTVNEMPIIKVSILNSNKIQIDSIEKHDAQEKQTKQSMQVDEEAVETMTSTDLKKIIVEELSVPIVGNNVEVVTEHIADNPECSTDIALEDVLESFFIKEEALKEHMNTVLTRTVSSDEQILMDSLFADCEKQVHQAGDLGVILDDGKPLIEQQELLPEGESHTICYIIQEGEGSPAMSVQYSDQSTITRSDISPRLAKIKGPHINIIQNYQKYPFQPKVSKRRGTLRKVIGRVPPVKARKKRPDSDEEYFPTNYLRSRRITRPLTRNITVSTTNFVPTGAQRVTDSANIESTGREGNEGSALYSCIDMPTLEDDLALTSSGSSFTTVLTNMNDETSSKTSDQQGDKQGVVVEAPRVSEGTTTKAAPNEKPGSQLAVTVPKRRGRRPKQPDPEIFICSPVGSKSSITTPSHNRKRGAKKAPIRRNNKRIFSASEEDSPAYSRYGRSEDDSDTPSSVTASHVTSNEQLIHEADNPKQASDINKMSNLQVIISPLTDDKIRRINSPKKIKNAMTKASQTEICGLTWSVDFDQIDFCSDHFEKLRVLLNSGTAGNVLQRAGSVDFLRKSVGKKSATVTTSTAQKFEGIELPSRAKIHHSLGSHHGSHPLEKRVAASGGDNCRTQAEEFLFQRDKDETEIVTRYTDDQYARERMLQATKDLRTNFRVPKISKARSSSPQAVTSSTSNASVSKIKDDEQNIVAGSSRCSNYTPPNVSRSVEKVNEGQGLAGSNGSTRPSINEYIDDGNELSNSMVQNYTGSAGSVNFANAINLNYTASFKKKSEQAASSDQNGNTPAPVPLSLGGLSGLPDRSEMMRVKRTIKNDMPEPQSSLPIPTPPLSGFSSFGACGAFPFNRSYPNYSDMNMMKPVTYNGGMDMFGTSLPGPSNGMNELLAVVWEHMKQQQNPQFVQPSIPAAIHPAQPTAFGQMFSQMRNTMAPAEAPRLGERNEEMEMIGHLFGCYSFLTDGCYKAHCRYAHVLPKEEEVFQKLLCQNRDFIVKSYRFVASRDDLFVKYFPIYTRVMGRNHLRHQLVSTITDCEQSRRPLHYYRFVAEGLKISGTSPVEAVQIILDKHTKKNFHQISVLVELILETGNGIPTFLRWLEEFLNVKGYRYEIASINRLLDYFIISDRPLREMVKFLSQLVLRVTVGEESTINVRVLLEFVKKIGQDPDTALDVEAIVQKYANVVVVG
ncbi:uncharacterized protein LOC129780086 isoform X2 [Toxorhynchites rutilus septentrionalis]|uniref:uncharacterized protein LOC129780086 isoform X2 n=1 Tax=Toxorhynchites rutilus septentrionalis TaxID=329112 RepID=UPI002479DD04|nr:uncharacterized protein LOC129780086 isoform X2 [Toxorhynchites rutilus septentrionalis]